MRTPEPGETWLIRDSHGADIYILLFTEEPCAKGYLYCLVLWADEGLSLETGDYSHYSVAMARRIGSLLS